MKLAEVSLNNLISYGVELFAVQELALQDEISAELKRGLDISPRDLVLVVSLDEVTPAASIEAASITLRFNGRFFPPKRQADGSEIGLAPEEWAVRANDALSALGYKYEMGDPGEVIKFTVLVPSLTIDPGIKEAPEEQSADDQSAEEPVEAPQDAVEEPAQDAVEEPIDQPASEDPSPEPDAEETK